MPHLTQQLASPPPSCLTASCSRLFLGHSLEQSNDADSIFGVQTIPCAISSYSYSLLPPDGDNIRLLRLLLNEDEAAPLCCKLDKYSLQKPGQRTYLYEALSYIWGDLYKILPIYIGENRLQLLITVNLHAALSCLRDHSFERIMWVDAICID